MTLGIHEHDLQTKLKAAKKFLTQGHKVRVVVRFKGREVEHPERGLMLLTRFADETGGLVEGKSCKGRDFIMNMKPTQ